MVDWLSWIIQIVVNTFLDKSGIAAHYYYALTLNSVLRIWATGSVLRGFNTWWYNRFGNPRTKTHVQEWRKYLSTHASYLSMQKNLCNLYNRKKLDSNRHHLNWIINKKDSRHLSCILVFFLNRMFLLL